jgi:hypothetical protein
MVLITWVIGIVTTVTQFIRPPPYLLDDTDTSLFYFAPIVGAIAGELWGHWFNDFLCNRYIRNHNVEYQPENRLWGGWPPVLLGVSSLVRLAFHIGVTEIADVLSGPLRPKP